MTTEQKVDLVNDTWEEYGLMPALETVELPKSSWYYHRKEKVSYAEKYVHLHPHLEEVARQHPEYGYRRTTEELRNKYGYIINHKVVQRLHHLWDLALQRNTRAPRPSAVRQVIREANGRANLVAALEEINLFQVAYTDFTELRYAGGQKKAYLMPIIDHTSKLIYGWAIGERANTVLALEAWERAKHSFLVLQTSSNGMIIHHDQDPVFTSYDWTGQLLLKDNARVSYALGGAKDNPEMEGFISRFKSEGYSLFLDAQSVAELAEIVDQRIQYYNAERLHSSIGYHSPLNFIEQKAVNTLLSEVHI